MSKEVEKLTHKITCDICLQRHKKDLYKFTCERCDSSWFINVDDVGDRTILFCPMCGKEQDFSEELEEVNE